MEVDLSSSVQGESLAFCSVVDSLKALPEVTIKKSSGWKERMEAREESWESAREKLFEETLIYSALPECAVSLHDNLY